LGSFCKKRNSVRFTEKRLQRIVVAKAAETLAKEKDFPGGADQRNILMSKNRGRAAKAA
jgi:hypothetical protein